MRIQIKLFAHFRQGRFNAEFQEHPAGTPCRAIIQALGLTETEVGILMVNGCHATLDQELNDGDTLALFPLIGGG